jgi:hypothetical protein
VAAYVRFSFTGLTAADDRVDLRSDRPTGAMPGP